MQHQQKGLEHRHAAHPGKLPKTPPQRAALVGKEPSRGIHGHGVAAAPGDAPQKAPADVPPALGDAALLRAAAGTLPADGAIPEDGHEVFPLDDPIGHIGPVGDMVISRGQPRPFGGGAFPDDRAIPLFAQQVVALLPDAPKPRPFFGGDAIGAAESPMAPFAAEMHLSLVIQPDKNRAAVLESDELADVTPFLHPLVLQETGVPAGENPPSRPVGRLRLETAAIWVMFAQFFTPAVTSSLVPAASTRPAVVSPRMKSSPRANWVICRHCSVPCTDSLVSAHWAYTVPAAVTAAARPED